MSDLSPDNEVEPTIGNQFLSNVPEEDRAIVEKYINDWDKGVTQKFQEIHGSYEWVKDYGAQEDIESYKRIWDWIDQNPQDFYEKLGAALSESNPTPPVLEQPATPQVAGLPEEFVKQYQSTETRLDTALTWIEQQQQAQKQAEEDAALNNYLADLHKSHGDFDEDFVVAKMYRGMKAEEAIGQFQALIQGAKNQAASNQAAVPPILSSGSVPATAVDPSAMTRRDAKDLFAQILEAGSRANQ